MAKPTGAASKRTPPAQKGAALPDSLAVPLAFCLLALAAIYAYAAYGTEAALLAVPLSALLLSKRADLSRLLAALFMLSLFAAGCALWLHSDLSGWLGVVSYVFFTGMAAAAVTAPAGKAEAGRTSAAAAPPLWAVIALFAALAILLSYKALLGGGIYVYRDETALPDLQFFRDYFLQIVKHGAPQLDTAKRIVEGWVHFFLDYDAWGRIQFALTAFATLAGSFFVFERILAQEPSGAGLPPSRARLISMAGAFFYLVNPLNTQLFPSYYPSIDYALFPVFFYLLYRAFAGGDLRAALLSGLVCGFMFLMVVHTLIYLPISFLAVGAAASRRWKSWGSLPLGALAVFVLAALSSVLFILLPSLMISALTPLDGPNALNSDMLGLFSQVAALPRPMLMDYHVFWWPYVQYDYPLGDLFYPLSALFCGALLVHAARSRSDWAVMPLAALIAVFFLAKGSEPPFGSAYQWVNFNLPLGWLIRVPMKFNHVTPFFFSVLFVLLSSRLGASRGPRLFLYLAASVAFLSLFSWPFFSGDMAGVLAKQDQSIQVQDIRPINAILTQDRATVIPFTRDVWAIDADMLPYDSLLGEEARILNVSGNLGAMQPLAERLGAEYLLTDAAYLGRAGGLRPLYSGKALSLFRLKDSPSPFAATRDGYLCYCSVAAAASLINDPPSGTLPWVLELPYSQRGFPAESVSASDTAVLDSSRFVIPDLGSGIIVPFYQGTLSADTRSGWGRVETPGSDPGRTDFDIGENFVASDASDGNSVAISVGEPAHVSDLAFAVSEGSSYARDSFAFPPGQSFGESSLPLAGPAVYALNISANGTGGGNVSIYIVMRDEDGRMVSVVPLLDGGAGFSASRSLNLTVPQGAAASTLYIRYTPSGGAYRMDLRDFTLQRIVRIPGGPSVSSRFSVPEDGDYDIYLRLLESRDGGTLGARLDGAPLLPIQTDSGGERMAWEKIYSGRLSAGEHALMLVQGGGHNMVNIAFVQRAGGDPAQALAGKSLIYRLTGWGDFYSYGGSEGPAASVTISNPATASIYAISGGMYSVESDADGSIGVTIDGHPPGDRTYLAAGKHVVAVTPLGGNAVLRSVTLMKSAPGPHEAAPSILGYERIDASTYRVNVSSGGGPFFLVFGREFNPSWVATVDGAGNRPVSSYEAVNAYLLDFSGTRTITLSFAPQGYMYIGAALGAAGIAALALYVQRKKINKR